MITWNRRDDRKTRKDRKQYGKQDAESSKE
jgi:hypothetical protein